MAHLFPVREIREIRHTALSQHKRISFLLKRISFLCKELVSSCKSNYSPETPPYTQF